MFLGILIAFIAGVLFAVYLRSEKNDTPFSKELGIFSGEVANLVKKIPTIFEMKVEINQKNKNDDDDVIDSRR